MTHLPKVKAWLDHSYTCIRSPFYMGQPIDPIDLRHGSFGLTVAQQSTPTNERNPIN